jgi:hypothetical protein
MHPRRGCWLANTHYLEGLDTVRIYCCELLNGRWQKRAAQWLNREDPDGTLHPIFEPSPEPAKVPLSEVRRIA